MNNKLIVGLGNIGEQHNNTRHNVGFKFIDVLAKKHQVEINRHGFLGTYGILTINNTKIILLKPSTYMNLSGNSVLACMQFFKINYDEIIVVYDDKDLKLGEYKYKTTGSAGGHNGMKNIIDVLKTQDIKRVKIGIGNKPPHIDLATFVLSKFNKEEQQVVAKTINQISDQFKNINVAEFTNLATGKK